MGVAHTQMNLYITPFKKALKECLLCYRCYLLTQIIYRCLCKRLLGETFLYGNSTSDRFIRTRKGTQRVPFVLLVLFAYANNLTLLCANDYFVSPS